MIQLRDGRLRQLCAIVLGAFVCVTLPQAAAATVVEIYPGTNIQAQVNANPPGTYFVLKTGTHRQQSVWSKTGNTFAGEVGAVMSGARLLTSFARWGSYWVATGQTQQGARPYPDVDRNCRTGFERCGYPEDLFINNVPLRHVASLAQVGPGSWFFDYAADVIYFWDDPTGKTVETSITAGAFLGTPSNVTIWNVIIEKYATPTFGAAVTLGSNALIQYSVVRWNHYTGIWTGSGSRSLYNRVFENGCFGFTGSGPNILVEGNEISYNGYAGFDPFYGSGGTKWNETSSLTLRSNFSHHNMGPGLWADGNNINTLYEHNRVEDNYRGGIFHELSYDAVIRWNHSERNGTGKNYPWWTTGSGIEVLSSPNVQIYGNVVVDNWQGITATDDHRGTGRYGPWTVVNLHVHDNTIVSRFSDQGGGRTGIVDMYGSTAAFSPAANNRFELNIYTLGQKANYFFWNGYEVNENGWRSLGQDTAGTFNR